MPNTTLVVIGAGPKALALHVRAKVLRELGHPASDVVILESAHVGAHWDGSSGYTDGSSLLVTPPEKDVGFPYRSSGDSRVDRALSEYSWHAYLVVTGQLARWIDYGRPFPTHAQYAEYLGWVATTSGAAIRHGRVEDGGIEIEGSHWKVHYRDSLTRHRNTISCSGIVMTGPGEPRHLVDGQPEHFNVSDGATFWLPRRIADFRTIADGRIAVVGNGDTAASVVVALLDILPHANSVEIDLFCRRGVSYSKAESSAESEWLSDPADWPKLDVETRREFIRRTERGVFSATLKKRIDAAPNVRTERGMAREARMVGKRVDLNVQIGTDSPVSKGPYRRVIVATGFKRWSFQRLFADQTAFPMVDRKKFDDRWEDKKELRIAEAVRSDLSYPMPLETLKLYLPALGALAWGPGFSNLSCLGQMSERVLDSHRIVFASKP